ncbi:MAG: TusE/DsrC/DsvC family sulfur relay protein [Pseudomonadota bacterium]
MTSADQVTGSTLPLDEDGHLADAALWSEAVAVELARRDGLSLSEEQWWLIRFVRSHYLRYRMPPLMRVVIRALRTEPGQAQASSQTLYRWFPDGPIRLACRYAGLPKPDACI